MNEVFVKTVKIENASINYFSFGTGEKPFIIIPGSSIKSILLSREGVANAFSQYIAEKYTGYVFEYRRPMPKNFTAEEMAQDLAYAMKEIGISGAYIFGASLGGVVAQYIAIRYPELVSKIAVCSSIARPNETSRRVFKKWLELCDKGIPAPLIRDIIDKIYSQNYKEQFGDFFAAAENDATHEEIERFAIQINACDVSRTYDELKNVNCPVLAVGAKGDRVLTGEASEDIAKMTGGEYYLYDGYSHAVYDEAPDFIPMMFEFFRK